MPQTRSYEVSENLNASPLSKPGARSAHGEQRDLSLGLGRRVLEKVAVPPSRVWKHKVRGHLTCCQAADPDEGQDEGQEVASEWKRTEGAYEY
ncbi:hypothetical protein AMECASPLE_016866 [Ameca splendens]|uniref:Uncharacterized protein n=1 Tax=Ameca splendens TaxID=208324 RepID=A0ABV0YDV0_9TELE